MSWNSGVFRSVGNALVAEADGCLVDSCAAPAAADADDGDEIVAWSMDARWTLGGGFAREI